MDLRRWLRALRSRGEQAARTTLYRFAACDLTWVDGIGARAARTILTEGGLDLAAFPSEKHCVSWLHLAPRTAISGGRPLPGKKRANGKGATRRTLANLANTAKSLGYAFVSRDASDHQGN